MGDVKNKPWMEDTVPKPEPVEPVEKAGFRQALATMPRLLLNKALERFGLTLLTAIITTAMIVITKEWKAAIGFLLALVFAYMGLDIIWKYADGKIMVARMMVCKAKRSVRQRNLYHVILRDVSIEDYVGDVDTFKYDLAVSSKDSGIITSGTVLDIYIAENAPNAILAYEILGEKKEK